MLVIATIIAIAIAFAVVDYKNKKAHELRVHKNWLRLPDSENYMSNNRIQRGHRTGPICSHCGSHSIRQLGLSNRHETRRVHICNMCNSTLYRTYR